MDESCLDILGRWFDNYVSGFVPSSEDDRRNYSLKVDHTRNVCRDIALIAEGEGFSPADVTLARAVALMHDVGRFPQYEKYGTFSDAASVNHGELGARVLVESGVLDGVEDRKLVLDAVKYHNAFGVPDIQDERTVCFLRLLRDADKLDIWRVVLEFYDSPESERASAVGIGLAEGRYSEGNLGLIERGRVVPLSAVVTLDDYKLMQLSWVFDINFSTTLSVIVERDIIGRLSLHLPETEGVRRAVSSVSRQALSANK